MIDDPKIGLPKLFVQRLISRFDNGARLDRTLIQIGDVKLT